MKRLALFVLAAVAATACGGGGGATTPTPDTPVGEAAAPPAGTSNWAVSYRPATTSTCPVQTPAAGSASMIADPGSNTLALTDLGTSLSGTGPVTIVFAKDGTGKYAWADPSGLATISFRFATSTHAEGEAKRLPSPQTPCSATWPFLLDRQ